MNLSEEGCLLRNKTNLKQASKLSRDLGFHIFLLKNLYTAMSMSHIYYR